MEYSLSVLSAMGFGMDGALMTGSVAGGAAERGTTQSRAFLTSDSGFSLKVVGTLKPV
jgi:hypothetical protein